MPQATPPTVKPPEPPKPKAKPKAAGAAQTPKAAKSGGAGAGKDDLSPIPFTAKEISDKLGVPLENVEKYAPALASAMKDAGLTDKNTAIALLATIKVETGKFAPIPEYGGGVASNPHGGLQFKGRGFIQLTHDYNYKTYGDKIGVDLLHNPDKALEPDVAAKVMVEYFKDHNIPEMAKNNDWRSVRRAVNGGYNGWDTFSQAVQALNGGKALPMAPNTPTPDSGPSGASSSGAPAGSPGGSSGGAPAGSSGGASGGHSGGSSGGDSASVGGNSHPSGMSLPRTNGNGKPSSSGSSNNAAFIPGFDWQAFNQMMIDEGLSPEEAKEIADKVKKGDRKGAMALLKAKGLPTGKLDKLSKAVDKAPAMGAAHEKRDDWFISQYGSKSNPNEDLPGSDNGNCGPTSLTMVAKAFGKIDPSADQADSAIEESRRRMGESQDEHDGTSVAGIAKGAKSYGLDAKVRSDANLQTIQDELSQGRLVIAHVSTYHLSGNRGGGHYTVVTAIKDGKVYLNDPAHKEGPMVVDANVFMESINDRGTHAMVSIGP